jgi:signal transduction histidine kinase
VLVAALVALVLGTLLALMAARRFARPLADIAASAQSITRGETPRFPFSGIPDVDRLTANLRQMHDQLNERFESLRRRQSETAAIVDSMVEGVLSSDAKGRILTANPAVRRLLGYGETEQLPDLALLFRTKEAREALVTVLTGESIADREISLGDRTYLLNARPLPTGGAVVVLHDLTRLKRLETVRRDFVANASHELKTPLTAISGYAETLLADEPGPAISKRFLETILSNARRMQRLVDDQLDLSRIESGSWTPRRDQVAIEPAAREAWALATATEPAAPNFEIQLAPEATWIAADPDGLRQIFRNLFENAVRHTAPSGRVTVSATPDDGGIRISVADTGAGIGSEHLPRIFERFYRVDPSRSREQGGTGLGLAIVKHLVEGHGGRVWAESTLGTGTTIQIQWPVPPS